jgi:hypothetical protein
VDFCDGGYPPLQLKLSVPRTSANARGLLRELPVNPPEFRKNRRIAYLIRPELRPSRETARSHAHRLIPMEDVDP